MTEVLFFFAAALAIATALGIVLLENPFYSVLSLVANLIALALLFLLLEAQFVAFAQVVVYAGAVMVLYVFVSAYVGQPDHTPRPSGFINRLAPLFGLALFAELTIAVVGSGLQMLNSAGPDVPATYGTPAQIGELLLSKFLVPFELASFLLLITAVGALVLAQKRRGLDP
ncbi:MAG: NADH-quinone oxidoreductase subunit [Thermoleophilaceae bacterium]|jgi:NADH-quinone oxidoreductase subunit J|nr:NADH-quinone oxidoreductase subunit [Thermoleophilaceae bacterium]